jgi:hypothetical protein
MKPKTKKQLVCYHSEMAHSRPQNPINFRVDLFMRQRITVGVDFILRQRAFANIVRAARGRPSFPPTHLNRELVINVTRGCPRRDTLTIVEHPTFFSTG